MIITAIFALLLAGVHLLSNKLEFLQGIPRSKWLSFAGGVSVAYVFLHLLPELHARQQNLEENEPQLLSFLKHHLFLLALLGLAIFYGLERWVKLRREDETPLEEDSTPGKSTFWLHIGSFAIYNFIIGYVLSGKDPDHLRDLLLFTIAMGFHFAINDTALLDHHNHLYQKTGRWIVGGAVLAGWSLGSVITLPEEAVSAVFAVIGGGVILNVLKEELPEERKSNFWAFFIGTIAYSALLLIQE